MTVGFEEEIERAFHALRRSPSTLSLLMLDLDRFKAVSDNLSHPADNAVSRAVADRLRKLSRGTDHIARLGGNEFAIVVTDRHDQESLASYAWRLIAEISEPIDLSGQIVRIGVSNCVGTATPFGPQETAELLAATDHKAW